MFLRGMVICVKVLSFKPHVFLAVQLQTIKTAWAIDETTAVHKRGTQEPYSN